MAFCPYDLWSWSYNIELGKSWNNVIGSANGSIPGGTSGEWGILGMTGVVNIAYIMLSIEYSSISHTYVAAHMHPCILNGHISESSYRTIQVWASVARIILFDLCCLDPVECCIKVEWPWKTLWINLVLIRRTAFCLFHSRKKNWPVIIFHKV